MGKWLARLAAPDDAGKEKNSGTPLHTHCQNCQNPGSVSFGSDPGGGSEEFSGAPAWSDADIARFLARRDRLLRWGWPESEAERVAERLARRDRSSAAGDPDDRVACALDCAHYRPGRCANHRRAGLHSGELGRSLAGLLQRCPGFAGRTE